uniref:CSON002889 protein n=1 Tax=Culicoides sonorensis TaxID=179676 RepID=A0A336MK82_CULSO
MIENLQVKPEEVLNTRLDNRVDGMVEMGLLPEIRKFYDEFIQLNHCLDYTKGVLQTIGFKEFIPYLEKYSKDEDQRIIEFLKSLNGNQNDFPDSLKLLNSCLDELKLVTRRYSKKQVKWIKNRFLVNLSRQIPPIYSLDTSQPQNWNEIVKNPAETILNAYINDEPMNFKPLEKIKDPRQEMSEDTSHFCEICERLFIGDFQYQLHIKGNKHKKVLASKRKKEKKNLVKNE